MWARTTRDSRLGTSGSAIYLIRTFAHVDVMHSTLCVRHKRLQRFASHAIPRQVPMGAFYKFPGQPGLAFGRFVNPLHGAVAAEGISEFRAAKLLVF